MEALGEAGCEVSRGVEGGGRGPAGEKDEVEEGEPEAGESSEGGVGCGRVLLCVESSTGTLAEVG